MTILKEKKFYAFWPEDADENIALVILEDGTELLVHNNGTAEDASGNRYFHVSREEDTVSEPSLDAWAFLYEDKRILPDKELVDVGWTVDADAPVIL
ncbi:MAG: hypothetical protein IJT44_02350 [Clostridia bacterium]|nr:hypothetical protein [Clostridia bacterium]